jgi:ComF family protein
LPFTEYTFNVENAVDRIFFGRTAVKKASSFLFYRKNNKVQHLIHHLKYKNQEQIGTFLGNWYGQVLKTDNGLVNKIDLVVPVPLHPKKLKKRGYNQVAEFAKRLAYHLNADYSDALLLKTSNNKTQTIKGRLGRWQEDKSLFALSSIAPFQNKNILLVDDVITTGATMEMCAETLHQIPGINIYIASMAVVPLN